MTVLIIFIATKIVQFAAIISVFWPTLNKTRAVTGLKFSVFKILFVGAFLTGSVFIAPLENYQHYEQ